MSRPKRPQTEMSRDRNDPDRNDPDRNGQTQLARQKSRLPILCLCHQLIVRQLLKV